MDVEAGEQLRRIKARNPEVAEDFKQKWIPLEEAFFEEYDIANKADIKY
jgi:hypothetical protein